MNRRLYVAILIALLAPIGVQAQRISAFPLAGAAQSNDLIPSVRNGVNQDITPQLIINLMGYSDLVRALAGTPLLQSGVGVPNGIAPLDANGLVPLSHLPSSLGSGGGSSYGIGSGLSLTGNVLSANIPLVFGRTGNITLLASDITVAQGYASYNGAANPLGFLTSSTGVTSFNGQTGNITFNGGSSSGSAYSFTAPLSVNGSNAVLLAIGTTSGTVAAGNDTRIVGALQASAAASTYAPLASPTFTGTPSVPGYLTTSAAASTYAPASTSAGYVRSIYTTGPVTVPLTDNESIINSTATIAVTLPNETVNGACHTIKRFGSGEVDVMATVDGALQTIQMNTTYGIRENLKACWVTQLSSYKAD